MPDDFGLALLLSPTRSDRSIAALSISLIDTNDATSAAPDICADASLEVLRSAIPAAAALPMLIALRLNFQ